MKFPIDGNIKNVPVTTMGYRIKNKNPHKVVGNKKIFQTTNQIVIP
jgi:hypothetical protein